LCSGWGWRWGGGQGEVSVSKVFYSLVVAVGYGADGSCSVTCFKVHKENCTPKENVADTDTNDQARPVTQDKILKEYNLLSAGQLAILRTPPPSLLTRQKSRNHRTTQLPRLQNLLPQPAKGDPLPNRPKRAHSVRRRDSGTRINTNTTSPHRRVRGSSLLARGHN
jgi:hypothetical protein